MMVVVHFRKVMILAFPIIGNLRIIPNLRYKIGYFLFHQFMLLRFFLLNNVIFVTFYWILYFDVVLELEVFEQKFIIIIIC